MAAAASVLLLLAAAAVGRLHLGWLLRDGPLASAKSVKAWQKLLECQMLPVFTLYYAAWGEPPKVAAASAASIAAYYSKKFTCEQLFSFVFAAFGYLFGLCVQRVESFLAALKKRSPS